jgi:two-component sensor histidine kinase
MPTPIAERQVMGRTLRELIGGRWAISWIAYVINLPINLIGISSNVVDASDVDPSTWFAIWAVGYATLGGVLLLAHLTLFRHRRTHPVPISWVVALGAAAGGARGLTVGLLADSAGVSGGGFGLVVTRTLTGAALGMILIPSAALLLAIISAYHSERTRLVEAMTDLEVLRMQAEGESSRLREALMTEAVDRILTEEPDAAAARRVSHEVWRQASAARVSDTRVSWSGVVTTAFLHNPYPGGPVAVVWSISALGAVLTAIGPIRGIMQVALSAFALWWILRAGRCIAPRGPVTGLLWFAVVMAVAVLVTGPVASMVFDDRPSGAATGLILANAMWIPALTIIVSIALGALRSSEAVVARLTDQVRVEEVAALAAQQERERAATDVAEAIHGLQSRLYTARAVPGATVDISDLLAAGEDGRSPREILHGVITPWASLMHVDEPALPPDLTAPQARDAARIIQEALANAYRHGRAGSCVVDISMADGFVLIEVTDDGRGLDQDRQPGLGSSIVDSATRGHWMLDNRPAGGCVLRARLT